MKYYVCILTDKQRSEIMTEVVWGQTIETDDIDRLVVEVTQVVECEDD